MCNIVQLTKSIIKNVYRLTYIDNIDVNPVNVLACFRYCNVVQIGLCRAPTEDIVFRGYTIPADAIVILDKDSILTDPAIWTDPQVFRPDRFISKDGNIIKQEDNIVFSIGKVKI